MASHAPAAPGSTAGFGAAPAHPPRLPWSLAVPAIGLLSAAMWLAVGWLIVSLF